MSTDYSYAKKKKIYLDNGTTTRPSERAISKMLPYLTDYWGVPTAPHQKGQELFSIMEESYREIYALLGAKEEDHFIFTSSGPEAVNHVLFSTYLEVTRGTGKNQFVTSTIDEAPTMMSISRLEQLGCTGKMVEAGKGGFVKADALIQALSPKTALVSLSYANGLTGVINPVEELAEACQERGVLLHLDATHVLGKLFEPVMADFLTFNGDHLHAPKGTGGLWIRKGVKHAPFIVGGLDQAAQRAGHLDVPALAALGVVAQEALECRDLICTETARLRDRLEKKIIEGFPQAVVFFKDSNRLPHITAIGFPGAVNEALLYTLNQNGVFASIGGSVSQKLSLILQASGIPETLAQTAISFGLSRETNEDEIDKAAEIVVESAKKLAKTSSHLLERPA